jgi:Ca2+-binding EF-hand superfamily protein
MSLMKMTLGIRVYKFITPIVIEHYIMKDKMEKNKEAFKETTLIKIDAEETLEHLVDVNKIKEIRLALRRRYASRQNYREIFKNWDCRSHGEISAEDAIKMIKRLEIPINYNECRALISTANVRDTESLNLQEFINLIFSDNPQLDLDLKKIKYKEEKIFKAEDQAAEYREKLRQEMSAANKRTELAFIKNYLRVRVPFIVTTFEQANEGIGDKMCDYETFSKVLNALKLPVKYTTDPMLTTLFGEFKENPKDEKINYERFINRIISRKEINEFFNEKEVKI